MGGNSGIVSVDLLTPEYVAIGREQAHVVVHRVLYNLPPNYRDAPDGGLLERREDNQLPAKLLAAQNVGCSAGSNWA